MTHVWIVSWFKVAMVKSLESILLWSISRILQCDKEHGFAVLVTLDGVILWFSEVGRMSPTSDFYLINHIMDQG